MKVFSKAIVFGALLAASILAQPPGGGPPDPATMVQHRVERLTALLNLTASQVTQATTIFTNAQTMITPLQSNLETYRTALHAAVKSNATATIDQTATSIGAVNGQILAIQSKADAAFYAILTPDQQAKLNALPGGGFGGGPGPGFGPRGRGGQ